MSHLANESKIFLYNPDLESISDENKEYKYFNPIYNDKNYKSMVDVCVQTEPKFIELDDSPEKDYSFLKEQTKVDNQYLNKKRK